jgi:hypothetical protein
MDRRTRSFRLGDPPLSRSPDIVIVGAGIVGAACAAACARGGLTVLVLDRGPIGGGTTAAGMGHVVVMDDSPAQFALTSCSRRLWHETASRLPADVEYDPCGTLWVAADAEEMAEVHRKAAFYRERKVKVEILDGPAVAQAEPNLRPGMAGGLLVIEDAVVYPPGAARFFLEDAAAATGRIEVRPGVSVTTLNTDGSVTLARRIARHRRPGGECRRAVVPGVVAWSAGAQAQGASGDHRPLPRVRPPSDCGTRLPEKRAFGLQGLGRVQHPTAPDRPDAPRFVTPVRRRRHGDRSPDSRPDAATRPRVPARLRWVVRDPLLDGTPRRKPRTSCR